MQLCVETPTPTQQIEEIADIKILIRYEQQYLIILIHHTGIVNYKLFLVSSCSE